MLTATSSIDRTTPDKVIVTVTVTGITGDVEAALILLNGGVARPSIDLAAVTAAVTNRPSAGQDLHEVANGAVYRVEFPVRGIGDPGTGRYLAEEANALAPLLVLALEDLLYSLALGILAEHQPVTVPLVHSWGPGGSCALAAPSYVHATALGGDGKTYNNTSRVAWQGATFRAEDVEVAVPTVDYNEEGDLSVSEYDDFGVPFPDGPRRNHPGNWPGGVVRVEGVDTRRADVYLTSVRIRKGSINPGAEALCDLDMSHAVKYKYGMQYAEVVLHNSDYSGDIRNRLHMYLYGGMALPASERDALLSDLAGLLPPDGQYPPTGAPFYRSNAAYNRPINLFNVRDGYLTLRKVYEDQHGRDIPNDRNDVVYSDNSSVVEVPYYPGVAAGLDRFPSKTKYYQKLVESTEGWDPIAGLSTLRLATALFYPPTRGAQPRLRENQIFDVYLRCTQHQYRVTSVGDVIDPPGATPGDSGSGYMHVLGAPFWGNTLIEVHATAGGCGVNCAGS